MSLRYSCLLFRVPLIERTDIKQSYSSSNGSSLAREAKKQLSERWKMTKCFQEVEVAGRGNTLDEMLAMPVQETRPGNLNYKIDKHGLYNQLSLNCGDANLGSPFCISSRNGWKDEHVRNLPRSRALPAATLANGNSKSRIKNEALHSDWCLMLQEAITLDKNELRKQNFSQRVSSNASGSKFICVKSLSFPCLDSENNHTIQENCVIQDEQENKLLGEDLSEVNSVVSKLSIHRVPCSNLEYNHTVQGTRVIQDELVNNFEEKDLSENFEQKSMVPDLSISGVASASVAADVVATAITEDVELSSGTHVEQQCELAAYILSERDGNPSYVLDASIGQESSIRSHEGPEPPSNCPGTDPELSIYFGEGYSPSPNSVLEPTFTDEILSVPECFKSVDSDLHGLRMQLQLLKSESEDVNSEGPGMVVSSDEDSGEGSVDLSEENIKLLGLFSAEESRDFSYLTDVLDEAGYHGGNLEMGFETWNSSKCPVSPSVFETLEKKYGEQTSWQKSERKLLFDRINSGLMEIVQPCMHMHMWEKPLRKRFNLSQSREVIEEELWTLLVSQEQEVSKDLAEKAVGRDLRWLELGDDIEVIGREIQRFLFDELVAELASTKIF
ncbi:hypothetical protein F0562_031790 [Nyssa sinensis]|uniref:DUF4378 domain-containing protein n=1 Tax=Nyssa sinensis TaxID=561372 RepID=A0A5J5ATI0_9ASTE|nr:hypothetical protein F0562_031790 [Nyssa sinensis]